MALQGTLDTFSLPDVLRLLATTGKTGCLHLDGDRGRGRVWMDEGSLVAATADRSNDGAPIDEVIFEMLRFDSGSFRFAVDEAAPGGAAPTDVEGALRRAGQLIDEWRTLEAVVPSLDHQVQMAPELTVDQVTIDGSRWEALVAIAGGRTVADLGSALGEGELGISRIVSDLVELGVAVVEPPSNGRRSATRERRNVTDIGSRLGDGDVNGRRGGGLPSRDVGPTGGDDPSRIWSPAAEADTAPTPTTPLGGERPSRYRDTGGSGRQASASLDPAPPSTGRSTGGTRAVGTVTPPGGTRKLESNGRTRQISTARSTRSRRSTPSTPSTTPANGSTMPVPQTRSSHALAPAPLPAPEGEPATEPPLRPLQPLPPDPSPSAETPLPVPERGSSPLRPPSLETPAAERGPIFPPSLETTIPPLQPLDPGQLGPAPLPNDTGQIPTIAASSLPADLTWAAEDDDAPIGPPTQATSVFGAPTPAPPPAPVPDPPTPPRGTAPARGRSRRTTAQPPVRPVPNGRVDNGETAAHVLAMSDEARSAVESTLGRSGGGHGNLAMAGASQQQLVNRGQLLRFLSSVRS